ncbi:hypothetical protein [Acrocarpospora phusangensis]|uniref:hypothetical protein n=1 Tax=Acrocarpospora phusangensis TaxID=1070424 RepID=UPI0019520E9A|nr:hypothetical protein [Acrocarpospora phusangensis]
MGIVGFAGGIFSTINEAAPTTTFASGETVRVELDPAAKPAIWAAADQATNVECQVQGADPSQKITLTQPGASQTLTIGSTQWEMLFVVGVPSAGSYQVSCDGEGVRFGVGKELIGGAEKIVGGVLLLLGLPVIGFLIAVVVTIVVLAKRSGARKRQMMY